MTEIQKAVLSVLKKNKCVSPALLQRKFKVPYLSAYKLCVWLTTLDDEKISYEEDENSIVVFRK